MQNVSRVCLLLVEPIRCLHQQLTFPLKPLSEQVGGGIEKQRKRHQLLRAEAEDRDCAQENIQAARQHLKLQITANVVCNGLRNASTKEAIAQCSSALQRPKMRIRGRVPDLLLGGQKKGKI